MLIYPSPWKLKDMVDWMFHKQIENSSPLFRNFFFPFLRWPILSHFSPRWQFLQDRFEIVLKFFINGLLKTWCGKPTYIVSVNSWNVKPEPLLSNYLSCNQTCKVSYFQILYIQVDRCQLKIFALDWKFSPFCREIQRHQRWLVPQALHISISITRNIEKFAV